MEGIEVVCQQSDYIIVNAPPGQTCGDYFKAFFDMGGAGYLGNPNATNTCDYCQYTTGSDFYEQRIGWSYSNRWRDFGILTLFTGANVVFFMFFVFMFRKQKR
jgi:ABC-type multidrug transport system permease subunit